MDPKKLIELARGGDKKAFAKLYENYYVPIFRYIRFRITKKEDTQDLVQTVFMKVYQSIDRYKDDGRGPLPYFFTVARNTVIDYLKKKKELALYDFVETEAGEKDSPEESAEKKEIEELVKSAIGTLNNNQKEIILLKFMAGLTNSEISKTTGKSEDAIRQIQHRALKILKVKLKIYEKN